MLRDNETSKQIQFQPNMSSAGGLVQRRRGGGNSAGDISTESVTDKRQSYDNKGGLASAADYDDDNEKGSKQNKLTLLDEVFLLGLKDSQVCAYVKAGISFVLERQHFVCFTRMYFNGIITA